LIFKHNGIGEKTYKYIITGVFDSSEVADALIEKLRIADKHISEIKNEFVVPENTSIQSRLTSDIFENQDNLKFKLNYFTGGPGKKQTALGTTSTRFVIPYQNVNKTGLVITGQLFTQGGAKFPIDSLTVFNLIDVRVILNNYRTADIMVPASSPAETGEKANVNWVLFGFPFEQVLSDSVFKQLGKIEKMEDGQWVVYRYNESAQPGFNLFNQSALSVNEAYFIAQSVNETMNLSYRYNNSVITRKLSDDLIQLEAGKWKTIANPYTFEVEVDTPAVLYRFDTQSKSYKLTNIMRPGEGYFVPPDVTELRLINFGEYFPVLFPKIISNSEWYLRIEANDESKNEELFIAYDGSGSLQKKIPENLFYKKAPNLEKGFEFSLISQGGSEYSAVITNKVNNKYYISLAGAQDADTRLILQEAGQLPAGISFIIYDEAANKIIDGNNFTIASGTRLVLIFGDSEYLQAELDKISSSNIYSFELCQNYPNPFNPVTTINYSIPGKGYTRITVYDILGRKVKILVEAELEPGTYSVDFNAAGLSSGIYLYKIESNNYSMSKKMILLK
jgi:hypothetical protein